MSAPEVVDLPEGELREAVRLAQQSLARVSQLVAERAPSRATGRIVLQGEALDRGLLALVLIAQEAP